MPQIPHVGPFWRYPGDPALALGLTLAASLLLAQEPHELHVSCRFRIFVCSGPCLKPAPAVAKDASGNTSNERRGNLSPRDKSSQAAGTFTRKSPSGMVLDTGVWLASAL